MKLLIALLISVTQSHAVYLNHCSNISSPGQPVSYSYESCVNRNFFTIQSEINGLYLPHCFNSSRDVVDYSFTSCINRNFRSIAVRLREYAPSCFNYNRHKLDYTFTSCVSSNYRTIERKLNRL